MPHLSYITHIGMAVATYVIALAVSVKRLINVLLETNAINNNEAVHSPFYDTRVSVANVH